MSNIIEDGKKYLEILNAALPQPTNVDAQGLENFQKFLRERDLLAENLIKNGLMTNNLVDRAQVFVSSLQDSIDQNGVKKSLPPDYLSTIQEFDKWIKGVTNTAGMADNAQQAAEKAVESAASTPGAVPAVASGGLFGALSNMLFNKGAQKDMNVVQPKPSASVNQGDNGFSTDKPSPVSIEMPGGQGYFHATLEQGPPPTKAAEDNDASKSIAGIGAPEVAGATVVAGAGATMLETANTQIQNLDDVVNKFSSGELSSEEVMKRLESMQPDVDGINGDELDGTDDDQKKLQESVEGIRGKLNDIEASVGENDETSRIVKMARAIADKIREAAELLARKLEEKLSQGDDNDAGPSAKSAPKMKM